MQSAALIAHHHQNVTRNSERKDALICNLMTTHLTTQHHRKCELNSNNNNSSNSESDTSTNVHLRNNKSKRNSNSRRCVVNRRRRKVQCSGTCLVFLVLTCLVFKTELVLGALTHNSNSRLNSVNYSHDNYTTKTLTASDNLPFLDEADALFGNSYGFNETLIASPRPQVIYQNEFAVHIVGGEEKANDIAAKHGFTNLGQVRKRLFYTYVYFWNDYLLSLQLFLKSCLHGHPKVI
jgi:Peptidase S8 pro-domain